MLLATVNDSLLSCFPSQKWLSLQLRKFQVSFTYLLLNNYIRLCVFDLEFHVLNQMYVIYSTALSTHPYFKRYSTKHVQLQLRLSMPTQCFFCTHDQLGINKTYNASRINTKTFNMLNIQVLCVYSLQGTPVRHTHGHLTWVRISGHFRHQIMQPTTTTF